MLTIQNYVKANTLEEAYELNQARNSRILGGMMWLRLGNARIKTAIDLSGLGLDPSLGFSTILFWTFFHIDSH